jgi:hypothetical protein
MKILERRSLTYGNVNDVGTGGVRSQVLEATAGRDGALN